MRVSKFGLLRSSQPSEMKGAFADIVFKVSLLCTRQSVFFCECVLVLQSEHYVSAVLFTHGLYWLQREPVLGSTKTITCHVAAKSVSFWCVTVTCGIC
jgi:hypothetical protein